MSRAVKPKFKKYYRRMWYLIQLSTLKVLEPLIPEDNKKYNKTEF